MATSTVRSVVRKVRLPPLPSVKDLLGLYGLRARRQLSQNFLLEPKLIRKLVRVAGIIRDGEVCEVGPGPGGITRAILERDPSKVIVVEKDDRFQPMLDMLGQAAEGKLHIISGDILRLNMSELFSQDLKKEWNDERPNIHLIGNLPFSVSTPLIVRWLRDVSNRSNAWVYGRVPMTLTFQKEVAERICAPVNDEQRCRLSVMAQNWCRVKTSFIIKGRAFLPPPDVDVGVVKLTPLREPVIKLPFELVEKVVRQVFIYRQKYACKGAGTLFPVAQREKLVSKMFSEADLPKDIRPFRITVEEFGRLCEAYNSICESDPPLFAYNFRARKVRPNVAAEEPPEEQEDEETDVDEIDSIEDVTEDVECPPEEGKSEFHPT